MPEEVKHIQWQHMDKKRYYLFGTMFTMSVNMVLFPAELVTTRLQVQRTERVYKNTFHAVSKIIRTEGCRGLYKGFSVNQLNILTGQLHCTSYELSREQLSMFSLGTRGFLAGGAAALLEQCFVNPVDVMALRLMAQRRGKPSTSGVMNTASLVFREHGLRGFYCGFMASLLVEGLSSAVWWASYGLYLDLIGNMAPSGTSHLAIQTMAGALSGASAAIIRNPLGIIQVRQQVCALFMNDLGLQSICPITSSTQVVSTQVVSTHIKSNFDAHIKDY